MEQEVECLLHHSLYPVLPILSSIHHTLSPSNSPICHPFISMKITDPSICSPPLISSVYHQFHGVKYIIDHVSMFKAMSGQTLCGKFKGGRQPKLLCSLRGCLFSSSCFQFLLYVCVVEQ